MDLKELKRKLTVAINALEKCSLITPDERKLIDNDINKNGLQYYLWKVDINYVRAEQMNDARKVLKEVTLNHITELYDNEFLEK